jgi:acetyl esterase/lipase
MQGRTATCATDLTGLPDAYIDVGDIDIFRDGDVEYARRLSDAGVPTELHLHPGCMHAFDVLARGADVSQRAIADPGESPARPVSAEKFSGESCRSPFVSRNSVVRRIGARRGDGSSQYTTV